MKHNNRTSVVIILLISIFLSAITAILYAFVQGGDFYKGWFAAFVLCIPAFILLQIVWNWGGRSRMLAGMMLVAWILRLGFGMTAQKLLPIYGYREEPQQKQGYLFDDAYRRDEEAWRIVQDEDPTFFEPLTRKFNNDQYGGMEILGIWIYQYLSPDERRFSLIILLGAFLTAAGVPFLWKAIKNRWDLPMANIAAWIFVLYPDSIVYAGSPMREPFLTGILAIAFWALCTLHDHWKKSGIVLLLSFFAILPLSTFVAGALAICTVLWIWIESLVSRSKKWLWAGVIGIALAGLVILVAALPSIQEFIHYDIHTTEINSGWVEKVVGEIGGRFRTVFLAVYGITQPVLPAILFYRPTTPFWKAVGIFRAVGWYAMVPFLFYAFFTTLRAKNSKERGLLIINTLFLIGWIFVSSLRAGGDQWDNPRYRVIFLPWLAFFTAWGFRYAKQIKDGWLIRWILIEIIFVGFFSQWYFSRYYADIIHRFPFWKTVVYIVICSTVVFASGLVQPILKKIRKNKEKR